MHTCPAPGCTIECDAGRMMCKPHWFALPKPLRDAVYATYTQGQTARTASASYMANLRSAVEYLRESTRASQPDDVTMQAITIWQPWADLIAIGAKPYEFRSWRPSSVHIGQRIAIHAGARGIKRPEIQDLLHRLKTAPETTGLDPELARPLLDLALTSPGAFVRGAVVCTAVLGRPIDQETIAARLGVQLTNDSDRDHFSKWGWPLSQIVRLSPSEPARGDRQLWPVTLPRRAAP